MTTWKIRHQGSPESLENQTAEQIVEGVQEGLWEPTDEVLGPGDREWVSLEQHPHFADAMADLDPPFAPPHPDETRLDMNPLIDVALVLLIFFILTTTYQELRKMFPAPEEMVQKKDQKSIGEGELRQVAIMVKAGMEGGSPVIRVENEVVAEKDLQEKIVQWKQKTGHSRLAVDIDKNVPWKVFMAIQDAAAGAKIQETLRIERPSTSE